MIASFDDITIWIALIALNMTVLGLSSMAEKRSVAGVEYGRYMLDKYKVFGIVRIYYLLLGIAVADVLAFIAMWIPQNPCLSHAVFGLLCLSTCIVIYFLFWYVLRVHKGVKKQIYKDELQGLYIDSDKECDFEADRLVKIKNGDRTPKKLSSNLLQYFNHYTEESIEAFKEMFGPQSVVYQSYTVPEGRSHDYSVYYKGQDTGLKHISWEFFQMFRYSEVQERWILEVLNLYNRDYSESFPRLRLFNVARIVGQINLMGFAAGLYKYKFLDYFLPYVYDALDESNDEAPEERAEVEEYVFRNLGAFMSGTMMTHPTPAYTTSVRKFLVQLLLPKNYRGVTTLERRLQLLSNPKCAEYTSLLSSVSDEICKTPVVFDFGNVLVQWSLDNLFLKHYKDDDWYATMKATVFTKEWIAEVDTNESIHEVVSKRKEQFPQYAESLDLFADHWLETLSGEMPGMRQLIEDLKKKGYPIYGLSNWCKDIFEKARETYSILQLIDNYVVSGGLIDDDGTPCPPKPDERIFNLFLRRYSLKAQDCIFIDDSEANVATARSIGMTALVFKDAQHLTSRF